MSITEFTALVRRRIAIVLLLAICVAAAVTFWTMRTETVYDATATLYVSIRGTPTTLPVEIPEDLREAIEEAQAAGAQEEGGGVPQFPLPPAVQFITPDVRPVHDQVIDSYAELAQSAPLLDRAAERMETDAPPPLAGKVTVVHPPQSQLIEVTARDIDPEDAAEIANAVGREVAQSVRRWESEPGVGSPVNVRLAVPAAAPASPAAPNSTRNILLGVLVGLVLGLAAAIIREIFDTRLREPAAVRDVLDLPILATIDFDRKVRSHAMLLRQEDLDEEEIAQERLAEIWSRSRIAEEFRQLRVNLQFFSLDGRNRSIAVTSSKPGEGKTTTAGNLAITMALAGESVALVDCDLRNPSIHRVLGIEVSTGLTDVLIGRSDLDDALVSGRRLSVLPAGSIPPNPTELLGSQGMADVLTELHRRFGFVIVDMPPTLPFADPAVIAPLCGATLLVVRINHTRIGELERASTTLRGVDASLCGAVINMVKANRSLRRGYYSYYYAGGRKRDLTDLSGTGFGELVPRSSNGRTNGSRVAPPDAAEHRLSPGDSEAR